MAQPAIADRQRVLPELLHDRPDDAGAGEDHVGALRLQADDLAARVDVARPVELDLPIDLVAIEDGALHDVRVIRGHAVAHGCHVRERSTHPDQRVRRRPAVEPSQVGRDRGECLGKHIGRDRSIQAESLGVANRPDVDAEALLDAGVGTERELAAAATGVEHDERALREADPLNHGKIRQATLLLAGHHFAANPGSFV